MKGRAGGAVRLIAITDRSVASRAETLARFERIARLARPGSVMFQLRDHELSIGERLASGRELRSLCAAERQWFQVNDRLDLAMLLDADALHLGEASVSASDARRVVGDSMFVSRACHDPERALEDGVDAWVLSPIFEVRKGRDALGMPVVSRMCQRGASVFILGGVTVENAAACVEAGAAGVAAIGAVLRSQEIVELLEALEISR